MKLKQTFERRDVMREREGPPPEPVQVDDIVSWDKQPKALKEIYGDKGRSYGRVKSVELENGIRYARVNLLRAGDFQDFDCRTLAMRIKEGSIQIEDPYQLLQLISDSLWTSNPDAAASISAIVQEHIQ